MELGIQYGMLLANKLACLYIKSKKSKQNVLF